MSKILQIRMVICVLTLLEQDWKQDGDLATDAGCNEWPYGSRKAVA